MKYALKPSESCHFMDFCFVWENAGLDLLGAVVNAVCVLVISQRGCAGAAGAENCQRLQ